MPLTCHSIAEPDLRPRRARPRPFHPGRLGRDERPWGGDSPPAAWYRFSDDRKGQHPKDHLARFRGWMHADSYAGLNDLYRSGAIHEVACMAHVRRKFVDIHRSRGSPIAEEALGRTAAPTCGAPMPPLSSTGLGAERSSHAIIIWHHLTRHGIFF